MVDRSGPYRRDNNSTSYVHPNEENLFNLHKAMDYNADGQPIIRTSIGGESVTITGNVSIPSSIEISNDTGNPIPTTVIQPIAVTDNGGSLTVDGNVGIIGDVNATITGLPPVGSNKPFYLEVAQNLISGYSFNHKFGAVPSMSSGATGSIWDINDTLYPWDALGTGSIINVERNNASDNGKIVTIQGLDENYEFTEESIEITGADQIGSQLFTRVNRAFVVDAGGSNIGNIDIEVGTPGGTTVARILAGYGQTLMAVYTIPAGKTGYLLHGTATGSSDTDAEGLMMVRYFGTDSFRIGHAFELQLRGGQYDYTFTVPIPVPEKTDIDVRAIMRSNNKRITAAFDILLVDND